MIFRFCATILLVGTPLVASVCEAEIKTESRSCSEFADVEVPSYKIVRKLKNDLSSGLTIMISTPATGRSKDKLIALACRLGQRYLNERSLFVWLFDSRRAAKRYNIQGEGNEQRTVDSLLGIYGFNRDEKLDQALTWFPNSDHSNSVRILLGPAPV